MTGGNTFTVRPKEVDDFPVDGAEGEWPILIGGSRRQEWGNRPGVHQHDRTLRRHTRRGWLNGDMAESTDPSEVHVRPPETSAAGVPAVITSITRSLELMGTRRTLRTLSVINQPEGFDCPGCAWPEAAPGMRDRVEFCENGAKAVAEEAMTARADPAFFARHSIDDLRGRSDHWLGHAGRLTTPMIRRPGETHYVPISWQDAFDAIARELRGLDHPNQASFYTSGRTSNEAAFLWQLLVRSFGTNNLPDCSNMCHEATSVALADAIGIGKGSVTLEDFDDADVILVVGQNPGTNHPRMLTTLEAAAARGAHIVAVNPLPEAGLLRFRNPQTVRGVIGSGTALATTHLPISLGGDRALFQLWNRWLLQREATRPGTIDREFIDEHCGGFDQLAAHLETIDVDALLAETGLGEVEVRQAFETVAGARRLIICWAMGITQHVGAVDTIREMTNLALLGGHIGRRGAGLCPVRGHSNVQGDRTMGIWEHPKSAFLDALEAEFGVSMPREAGLDVVDTVRAMVSGELKVMIGLGGNLLKAVSDSDVAEAAHAGMDLTVQISTKLNRTHVIGGATSIILPTLGRTELDRSPRGEQFVTVEDSMSLVHASRGVLDPASAELLSEAAIVCDMARAIFGDDHPVRWAMLRDDNDAVRDHIARVVPGFDEFNRRVRIPGGFALPHGPRDDRTFATPSGRAEFAVTRATPVERAPGTLTLQTLRSHDQYNTTIYGFDDRYRGISGNRQVIMVNPADLDELGLANGELVDIVALFDDRDRRVLGFRVVAYPTPRGCAAAYYPETNPLIALDHQSTESGTPASKAVPIRLARHTPPG